MSIEDLLTQLPGSATLVTSTRRLSGDLLRRYHAQKLKGGLTIWETPDIVPWSDWIERCWQGSQSLDDPRYQYRFLIMTNRAIANTAGTVRTKAVSVVRSKGSERALRQSS